MANLTQMELNTLKALIAMEDLNTKKFRLYADNCQDSQLKNFFAGEAKQSYNTTRTLMNFLTQ